MCDGERPFFDCARANPGDFFYQQLWADWLDEQGRPFEAAVRRAGPRLVYGHEKAPAFDERGRLSVWPGRQWKFCWDCVIPPGDPGGLPVPFLLVRAAKGPEWAVVDAATPLVLPAPGGRKIIGGKYDTVVLNGGLLPG